MSRSTTRPLAPSYGIAGRRVTLFEELLQVFSKWVGRFERLTSGPFESTIRTAASDRVRSFHAAANQSILARGRDEPGSMAIALVLPESSECLWQHRRLDAGCLVLRGGDVEVDHQTSRRAVRMDLQVGESDFLETARVLLRRDPGPVGWAVVRPSPVAFAQLEQQIRLFLQGAGTKSSSPQERMALEQACITAAIEAVFPTTTRRLDIQLPARTAVARRAEEYMRANLCIPKGEKDLCAELRVSVRTLRRAFLERYGLGPMVYYQSLRLNAVRTALQKAVSESTSIAQIGRTYGFTHPGKLAGYYSRLFGELPSESLKRSGDQESSD